MTRFQQELSGSLGPFWKQEAEKELARVKADLESGLITIDGNGIARNRIARVLMADMLEKLLLVTDKADKADKAATTAAREAEVSKELTAYRETKQSTSAEELAEMRATFGKGARVVNILTGEHINL